MNATKILVGVCSFFFLMIGADKFLSFLDPPCTLEGSIPASVWTAFGVLQLAAGILIWIPKYRRAVAMFFTVFMLVFTVVHFVKGTTDVGGAVFMAVLLGALAWHPKFSNKNKA